MPAVCRAYAGTGVVSARGDAKRLGVSRYFTGRPCNQGHVAERWTANKKCAECVRIQQRAKAAAPEAKEKRRAYDRERWLNDRERMEEKNRRYRAENAGAVAATKRAYYRANTTKLRVAREAWIVDNRHVVRHHNAKRKKLIRRATPPWVDIEKVKAVYREAERIEAATGVPHHVDHIIPLQGADVCGLHVPWNLRPLPAAMNLGKKNRLPAAA